MNERRSAALGLGKGQTTCRNPLSNRPGHYHYQCSGTPTASYWPPRTQVSDCQTMGCDGLECAGGPRWHLARAHDPPVKHAAPSTLFSALRRAESGKWKDLEPTPRPG